MQCTHLDRMRVERDELETKVDALTKFIGNNVYNSLSGTDQSLLLQQMAAMHTYIAILRLRIKLADDKE